MDRDEALDEIVRRLDVLTDETVNTSMRIPISLREAAAIAVEHLGLADSTTALTVDALRHTLESAVLSEALEQHYKQHPASRPRLAEVALALAEQIGSPLASNPELIAASADELLRRHPDADAHDVLLWTEALQSVA